MEALLKLLRIGLILLVSSISSLNAVATETIERSGERIGRWCDTTIPGMPELDYIIEIWKSENGQYSYHQLIKTKKSATPAINSYYAKKVNRTWQIQNDHGEYVRIGDDGFLRLYDGQGFIRRAVPIGPNTKPGQCRSR